MKKLLLIFIVLLIIPLASAAQISFTSETPALTIVYPKCDIFQEDTQLTLSFDILDSNFSRLKNDTTDCDFFMVDSAGEGISYGILNYSTSLNYWFYELNTTHTEVTGCFSYYVYCNSSNGENGFISEKFILTKDGLDDTPLDSTAGISIMLFILFSTGFLMFLPFIKKQFSKNQFVDLILKRCCWVIAAYLMILNSAIVATLIDAANIQLTTEIFRYMWLWGTGAWVFLGFTVLKTLFDVTDLWKKEVAKIRMGDDGK